MSAYEKSVGQIGDLFTFSSVVTSVTQSISEYSISSAATRPAAVKYVGYTGGTLYLSKSAANTGTVQTASIGVSTGAGNNVALVATLNNVVSTLAIYNLT